MTFSTSYSSRGQMLLDLVRGKAKSTLLPRVDDFDEEKIHEENEREWIELQPTTAQPPADSPDVIPASPTEYGDRYFEFENEPQVRECLPSTSTFLPFNQEYEEGTAMAHKLLHPFNSESSPEVSAPALQEYALEDVNSENDCEMQSNVRDGEWVPSSGDDASSIDSLSEPEHTNKLNEQFLPQKSHGDNINTDQIGDATHQPVRNRWNKERPSMWKRNVNKMKRKLGGHYVSTKGKHQSPKHPKLIDCSKTSKCRLECSEHFSGAMREGFCRAYWSMDFARQRDFILANVETHEPETRRPRKPDSTKKMRSQTRLYYFTVRNEKIRVCQKFFCATLCISNGPINNALTLKGEQGQYVGRDRRGEYPPSNKTSESEIARVKAHIESFPTVESHYTRKSSKRQYLDSCLNISKMYRLYKIKCEEENESSSSEITYRRIFCENYNLSFFKPKKDQCSTCSKYIHALPEAKMASENEYKEHCVRKDAAMKEKDLDKKKATHDKSFMSITCDLQSVLQIPSSGVSLLYYLRKINVYNFTVYEAAPPNNGYCFFWTEVNGKRGSCEIGSCLLKFIMDHVPHTVEHLTIFSDTCGGQNRNIQISALLLYAVSNHPTLKIIEQKFMESGHSYMEVDSMHSAIETAKKNVDVFSVHEWENIFRIARKSKDGYHTKELCFQDMLNLKHLVQTTVFNKNVDDAGQKVNWLKVKVFQYRRDEPESIGYKYGYQDEFRKIPLRMASARKSRASTLRMAETYLVPLYRNQLPISVAKKKDLTTLCRKGVIPQNLQQWFYGLQTSNAIVDRAAEPALSDASDEE